LRRFLLVLIVLECLLLVGGFGAYLFGQLDRFRQLPPAAAVFRPAIHDAVIGDFVRYERRDPATGRVLGYLDYEVKLALVTEGTTVGPEFIMQVRESDAAGGKRERIIRFQPSSPMHGFLPPRFEDEDDFPSGARPVVKRISTTTFALRGRETRGFLVEAVIPRKSLTEVAERYWMSDDVPVFGVARWERGDETLVLHRMERPERRG